MHSCAAIAAPVVRATAATVRLKGSLGLREFMHRSRVLSQYREFMRELKGMEATAAHELRVQVRTGFDKGKAERNVGNQKAMLLDGTRQLQFLRTYAGTARKPAAADGPLSPSFSTPPSGTGGGSSSSPGSWVGTGEEWDVRGRLGEAWPWSR